MGNFEAAVELCICENKMAEAILLAIAGGPELLQRTQKRFFSKNSSNIERVGVQFTNLKSTSKVW